MQSASPPSRAWAGRLPTASFWSCTARSRATAILSREGTPSPGVKASSEDEDAVGALMNLGFTRQESARAVERARKDGAKTIEEVISSRAEKHVKEGAHV